jgi:anaerobic magnesium-protoporphyrin IX monomethyl ester cyclase
MKILLMNPIRERTDHVAPDLGLGYLATWARKDGHEVYILDSNNLKLSFDDLRNKITLLKPDLVGIKLFTQDLTIVKNTLRLVKENNRGIVTVVGGAHPSALPEHTLRTLGDADYAFNGEAEIGFPKLLQFIAGKGQLADVPGLIWREENEIRVNRQLFVENLDELGMPAWDLLDPREYSDTAETFRKAFPAAPISITRGCPFPCTYCAGSTISGKPIRTRSIDNVLNEMQYLMDNYGVREFNIADDNFTHNRKVVEAFCQGIIDRKWKIYWSGSTGIRLDSLDENLLQLMRQSGCYSFYVGIESGSQPILDLMKKRLKIDQIRRGVEMISRSGILVSGFFIIGYPGETREDILKTIEFAKSLPLFKAHFFHFTALPATEAYETLLKEGKISGPDDSMFMDVSYVPEGFTANELKKLLRKAYLDFYLRPSVILSLLKRLSSPEQLKLIAKKMVNYFSFKN